MDTLTLLSRNVAELRSLLDLSYSRERALVDAVKGLLFLHEGAAVAPDRQPRVSETLEQVNATLRRLSDHPVPNHGLFAAFALVSAEHRAFSRLNATLTNALNTAQQRLADATVQTNNSLLRALEAEAVRDAVVELVSRPDLTDTVIAAVTELVRSRTVKGT